MKTYFFKKITSVILCIAMLIGFATINSFALEIGDTIEWTFDSDTDYSYTYEFVYMGEVFLGNNDVEAVYPKYNLLDINLSVYEFKAEKDGFYTFTSYGYINVAEKYENSKAYNYIDRICVDDQFPELYYFSEGTYLIRLDEFVNNTSYVDINYYGKITDIILDNEAEFEFVENVDLFYNTNDELYYSGTPINVHFENGKSIVCTDDYHLNFIGEKVKNSKNRLEIDFFGFKKEITAKVYDITYYIESIETSDLSQYKTSVIYFNESYDYTDFSNLEPLSLTVNFTDGTSQTVSYHKNDFSPEYTNQIILPNKKETFFFIYQEADYETNKKYLIIDIADHYFIKEECEIIAASLPENYDYLTTIIKESIVMYFNNISSTLFGIFNNTANISELFGNIFTFRYTKWIITNINMFLNYYISV